MIQQGNGNMVYVTMAADGRRIIEIEHDAHFDSDESVRYIKLSEPRFSQFDLKSFGKRLKDIIQVEFEPKRSTPQQSLTQTRPHAMQAQRSYLNDLHRREVEHAEARRKILLCAGLGAVLLTTFMALRS
jgi:hypothetical protein